MKTYLKIIAFYIETFKLIIFTNARISHELEHEIYVKIE